MYSPTASSRKQHSIRFNQAQYARSFPSAVITATRIVLLYLAHATSLALASFHCILSKARDRYSNFLSSGAPTHRQVAYSESLFHGTSTNPDLDNHYLRTYTNTSHTLNPAGYRHSGRSSPGLKLPLSLTKIIFPPSNANTTSTSCNLFYRPACSPPRKSVKSIIVGCIFKSQHYQTFAKPTASISTKLFSKAKPALSAVSPTGSTSTNLDHPIKYGNSGR